MSIVVSHLYIMDNDDENKWNDPYSEYYGKYFLEDYFLYNNEWYYWCVINVMGTLYTIPENEIFTIPIYQTNAANIDITSWEIINDDLFIDYEVTSDAYWWHSNDSPVDLFTSVYELKKTSFPLDIRFSIDGAVENASINFDGNSYNGSAVINNIDMDNVNDWNIRVNLSSKFQTASTWYNEIEDFPIYDARDKYVSLDLGFNSTARYNFINTNINDHIVFELPNKMGINQYPELIDEVVKIKDIPNSYINNVVATIDMPNFDFTNFDVLVSNSSVTVMGNYYYDIEEKIVKKGTSNIYETYTNELPMPYDIGNNYGSINIALEVNDVTNTFFDVLIPIGNVEVIAGTEFSKYFIVYIEDDDEVTYEDYELLINQNIVDETDINYADHLVEIANV